MLPDWLIALGQTGKEWAKIGSKNFKTEHSNLAVSNIGSVKSDTA